MRALVSPRTGIVAALRPLPRRGAESGLWRMTASTPDYGRLPGLSSVSTPGGTGFDREGAALPAVFEAVERYCGAFVDPAREVFRAAGGDDRFLCGDALPLYSARQHAAPGFPFRPLDAAAEVHWTPARALAGGAERWVPSLTVHVPYQPRPGEALHTLSTSTGMACGATPAAAALSGLLEVAERDAFMIMWLNRLSMPRLRVDPASRLGRELGALRATMGPHELHFVDLTGDIDIPVVLCLLERPLGGGAGPAVTVGASANPCAEVAARKAAFEALGQYLRLVEIHAAGAPAFCPAADFGNVDSFELHNLVYTDPGAAAALRFITASPIERALPAAPTCAARDPAAALADCVARFRARGLDPLCVDLTTRDVRELGLAALKIIVPGAVAMAGHHRYPLLGSPRLYRIACELGHRARPATHDDLNLDWPHPFA